MNLLTVHSTPSSRLLMKMPNKTDPVLTLRVLYLLLAYVYALHH